MYKYVLKKGLKHCDKNRHLVVVLFILLIVLFYFIIFTYYIYYKKDTIAIIIPANNSTVYLNAYLPSDTYVISILTTNPTVLKDEKIIGKIYFNEKIIRMFNFDEKKINMEWVKIFYDGGSNPSSKANNLPYPMTHHLDGYYTIHTLKHISVNESSWNKLMFNFEKLPYNIFIKIETLIEG